MCNYEGKICLRMLFRLLNSLALQVPKMLVSLGSPLPYGKGADIGGTGFSTTLKRRRFGLPTVPSGIYPFQTHSGYELLRKQLAINRRWNHSRSMSGHPDPEQRKNSAILARFPPHRPQL